MIGIEEKEHEPLIRYSFKKGEHAGDIYQARCKICENPVCSCCTLHLFLDSKNDQLLSPKFGVSLDLMKRSIAESSDRQFAQSLVDDFDDQDWKALAKLFVDRKTFYTESSDLMSLDATFPIDEIETSSKLISYHGILPFARHIHFAMGDIALLVEDLYCVQPFCDCHDAHLFFTPYDESRIFFPFLVENSNETYIIYNIKKNKWSLEEQTGNSIDPKQLMAAFRAAHDIQLIYRNRYETIRRLYENYRRRNSRPMIPYRNANIGRNDPCPCGSGRKYKKCCMLKNN
ncbi:SEC-C domain-containing protein [candidate division KSB1 bacterium]|nr:SEC-C domain-containing protein [candidate division KSB1 bacterium]